MLTINLNYYFALKFAKILNLISQINWARLIIATNFIIKSLLLFMHFLHNS